MRNAGGSDIRAVVFDVFGTVVDWRGGVARALAPFLVEHGLPFDPFQFADAWRSEYVPAMKEVRSGPRPFVPSTFCTGKIWTKYSCVSALSRHPFPPTRSTP
ncbi:FMN phosphatase YigB (HAD superfamily) [Paraburkholderia sp. WC7.3d]